MEDITRDNFRLHLATFVEKENITLPQVAKAIGCPEATLARIVAGTTVPTDELLKQGGAMFGIGFERYARLSEAEKERISEAMGAVGGGVLGFGTISAAISTLGVAGLSAAGITSGLAALGAIVGGGMLAGVSVAAAIPLAAGAVGYGIIKGIKHILSEEQLASTDIARHWELVPDDVSLQGEAAVEA